MRLDGILYFKLSVTRSRSQVMGGILILEGLEVGFDLSTQSNTLVEAHSYKLMVFGKCSE